MKLELGEHNQNANVSLINPNDSGSFAGKRRREKRSKDRNVLFSGETQIVNSSNEIALGDQINEHNQEENI